MLEVGCGTGRVLIPTARAGLQITGLDQSVAMLNICRERLAMENADVQKRVNLVEGDMRDFELGQRFQLVTIPFRPFYHLLTVEDQIACLHTIHRHLHEGGKLIFDIFNPSFESLIEQNIGVEGGEEPPFVTPDGRRVVRKFKVISRDLIQQISEIELIYDVTHPDGHEERLVHAYKMRHMFRYEAEHLLARCGFRVEQVYADFEKNPYGSQYPGELIFVASKEG